MLAWAEKLPVFTAQRSIDMPMGNGTGPNGQGPRTGRGAGFCNGFDAPGSYNRGGRGMGMGGGRGFARGRGGFGFGGAGAFSGRGLGFNQFADSRTYNNSSDYNEMLKDEAAFLEKRLTAVKEELKTKEKDSE